MKNITLIGFILMCLVQLYVPASMIFQNETIKSKGEVYKFKTVPVDPNDPFRGKFIRLDFAANQYTTVDTVHSISMMDKAYILLEKDAEGFAKVKNVMTSAPEKGQAYVRARVFYNYLRQDTSHYTIEYPFTRFYLEENKAPEAERLYIEALRDSQLTTYARVYIHKGQATLDEVLVNEVPIAEWVSRFPKPPVKEDTNE